MIRLISLGAGEQSTALALMAAERIVPNCDGAVFADTGGEPDEVYRHLMVLQLVCAAYGLPVYRVSKGSIEDDALDTEHRFASMPLYTKDAKGRVGMLRRQCSREYKVEEVHRKARDLLGKMRPKPGEVEMWVGISTDEAHRMKPSGKQYVVNRWPLIELGMSRADCRSFNESRGFHDVPKSACIVCPYTDRDRWRDMQVRRPEEFETAVQFERDIRNSPRFRADDVYLTRHAKPLDQIDFRNEEEAGQLNMFDAECEGVCGV